MVTTDKNFVLRSIILWQKCYDKVYVMLYQICVEFMKNNETSCII